MSLSDDNSIFSLAADAVNFTGCNIFLTGKAGTGKTTFLRHIRQHSHKNMVVLAPTGVAAINAGGMTMHSFFQLPFIPYLPDKKYTGDSMESVDKYQLIKNVRFSNEKIDLIKELELLIIDEVSMLRADMLDAMDEILRHYRRKSAPFGGLQVLFIGDMFQLPPVVGDAEWKMMKEQYQSPFFFSARVLERNPPLHIELKKIYRQSDQRFIDLLNNIRNNEMGTADFELLEKRTLPEVNDMKRDCITLATHNYMADEINRKELQKLKGPSFHFDGAVTGNFSEKALPTELKLELKEGAHVMFVKNDSGPGKKYFNGKLAVVKRIDKNTIVVNFSDNNEELILEKEKWKSVRYVLNKETGTTEEEELGSFTQYPIRLAWAITIHKSQGLTFDKVVIDAGKSFAPGQVYVALSRCRSLEGVHLLSKITPSSVKNDERIVAFGKKESGETEIRSKVSLEKPKYAALILMKVFDWMKTVQVLEEFLEETKTRKFNGKDMAVAAASNMLTKGRAQQQASEKFIEELRNVFSAPVSDQDVLAEKVKEAKRQFASGIKEELIGSLNGLQAQLKGKSKVRQYAKQVNQLESILWKKISDIQRATFGDLTFEVENIEPNNMTNLPPPERKAKPEKGASKSESLAFYKQGMSVPDIARQREMAITTIEGHLAEFIPTGDVDVFDFVNQQELERIREAVAKVGDERLTPIKAELGDDLSFGKIRMGVSYLKSGKR